MTTHKIQNDHHQGDKQEDVDEATGDFEEQPTAPEKEEYCREYK